MISVSNGEVYFADELIIVPHCPVRPLLLREHVRTQFASTVSRALTPLPGWRHHTLGVHGSAHGDFEVEVTSGPEDRIHAVFLSHVHSFYESDTPQDSERRTYHEAVIQIDLRGQREFPWGEVLCRLDTEANRDWLVVVYTHGPHVPLHAKEALRELSAHENAPTETRPAFERSASDSPAERCLVRQSWNLLHTRRGSTRAAKPVDTRAARNFTFTPVRFVAPVTIFRAQRRQLSFQAPAASFASKAFAAVVRRGSVSVPKNASAHGFSLRGFF